MFTHCNQLLHSHQRPLQILKDATLFFSRSMPNLARVIPAMDHIETTLSKGSLALSNDPAIRAALAIAQKTLNRYYELTDSSEVYRIAMGELHNSPISGLISFLLCVLIVLHPRHKLMYFQTAKWNDKWIKTAESLVRDEFERSYNCINELDIEVIDNDTEASSSETVNKSKVCVLFVAFKSFVLIQWMNIEHLR
jgi:hypothetical protein